MRVSQFESETIQKELVEAFERGCLVPIIGSGFTKGCKAKAGNVPSGKEMSDFMVQEIRKVDSISKLPNEFSQISTYYERKVDEVIRDSYLKENFTNVILERNKRKFLEIWDIIYTLNIDDGIERHAQCEVILPNNRNYKMGNFSDSQVLVKLHGDVNNVLKYSDDKKIFTRRQYFDSLKSNSELLSVFREDYYNNNIIYIGCSLDDETDLYSAVGDIENDKVLTKKYFVTTSDYDEFKQVQLEEYGVTDLITVNSYESFYELLVELYNNVNIEYQEDLEYYKNPTIVSKSIGHNENYEHLCFSINSIMKDKNELVLPHFFIERDEATKYIQNIGNSPICIVEGHRVSGKTYFLLDILRRIRERSVFYFPSSTLVSFDLLDELLEKENSVFLFDSNVLTRKQINYFINRMELFEKNENNLVIAINTSDKEILTTINYRNKNVELLKLSNRFSDSEVNELNKNLSLSDLLIFDQKKTLFDNLIAVTNGYSNYICKADNEKCYSIEELVVFIILATKDKLYDSELLNFGLTDTIGTLHESVSPVFQFDYTEWYEDAYRSRHKVIPNAKIWILQLLGNHSATLRDKKQVANAYKYIARRMKQNNRDDVKYFKSMSSFINFDIINEIFPSEENGVIDLITKIYDSLHDYLADDPQYFHQRAKAYLWLYQHDEDKLRESLKYAKKAAHDTKATRDFSDDKALTSYSHIEFSIAVILGRLAKVLNYSDKNLVKEALDMYNKALNEPRNAYYSNKLLRKTRSNNHERRDVRDLAKHLQHNANKYKEFKYDSEMLVNLIWKNSY